MDWSKLLKGIWIGLVALLIGRCVFFGMNPLVVGFMVAICVAGDNGFATYVGGIIGLATSLPILQVFRYGIIMLVVVAMFNIKYILDARGRELYIGALAGGISTLVTVSVGFFIDTQMEIALAILEGMLVFSSSLIYLYAIKTVKYDYGKVVTENQSSVSCIILAATILYGIPGELPGGIVPAETVGIFSILFAMYKFGFGIGMSWAVVASAIVAGLNENEAYFTTWIIVSVAAFAVFSLINGGRFIFATVYSGIYVISGLYFFPFLLSVQGIKALAGAVLVFALAPKKLMLKVDDSIKGGELGENSPEWSRLIINRINGLALAFKRIEYTLAGNVNAGIGFNDVGEIIEGFTNQLEHAVPMRKTIEAGIIEELAAKDIQVKNLVLIKNKEDRYEVYITSRVRRGRLVPATYIKNVVSKEMGMEMDLKDESRNIVSKNFEMICLQEKPSFACKTAVRCMSRYPGQISGDNFYIGNIDDGQKLIILADGMGNGEGAAGESNALIDAMEELLEAGFDRDTSIKIVNSYLADKNKGERFSTLDMMIMDMHTGYGRLYKQGAATTYVKRGEWIELIKSTSLPMGVIEGAVCESCKKKFYNNDIIVMVSDGVLESIIVENKEDYMRDLILNNFSTEPEDIANDIVEEIRSIGGNRLKDDATIIVVKLNKIK